MMFLHDFLLGTGSKGLAPVTIEAIDA